MKLNRSIPRRLVTATVVSLALATGNSTLAANEQLEFVPDDTLFYFGTGKPVAVEDFFAMMPGVFKAETLEKIVPGFNDAEGGDPVLKSITEFVEDPAKFTKEWGLGDELQFSAYTVGMLPVFRIAGDGKKFAEVLEKIDAEKEQKFDNLTHGDIQVRISPFENNDSKPPSIDVPTPAEIQSAESTLAAIKEESDIASETLQQANKDLDTAKADNNASGIAEAANRIATAAGTMSDISKQQVDAEKALASLRRKVDAAEKHNAAGGKSGAGMIIAANGDDLIFSISSNAYDPDILDQLLGIEKPEESLEASGKLGKIRKEWGYGDEMAMYLDFKLVADAITGGDSLAAEQLQAMAATDRFMQRDLESIAAEPCRSEIRGLAANWPMMVSGNRRFEVDDKTINFDSHFAMLMENESLRDTLKLLRGVVPVSQSNSDALLSFGLGLDLDTAPQLATQLTEFISSVSYECESLQSLNKISETDISTLSMGAVMVGGMARGVKGFSVNVYDTDVDLAGGMPVENLDAAIAIAAEDPEILLQTLQFLPQMNILADLPRDGTAVSLNDLLPVPVPPGIEIFAAVKEKSIVFFSGENAKDFAGRLGGNGEEGFIISSMNTESIIQKINDVVENLPESMREEESTDQVLGYLQTYPVGNLSYKIDFTDKGIELDSVYEIVRSPK